MSRAVADAAAHRANTPSNPQLLSSMNEAAKGPVVWPSPCAPGMNAAALPDRSAADTPPIWYTSMKIHKKLNIATLMRNSAAEKSKINAPTAKIIMAKVTSRGRS